MTDFYRTSDTQFSAFLLASGFRLLPLEKENKIVFFVFEDPGNIEELNNEYFNCELSIEPIKFMECYRTLKHRAMAFLR